MPQKDKYVKLKKCDRKIESPFVIYADFGNILVLEDKVKQITNVCYTTKYHKNVAWSYGNKLIYVDDKFSEPFKSDLGEDVPNNFISNMIGQSKYCSDMVKRHFNKELVMSKKDIKNLRTQLNVGSVIMIILTMMSK